MSTTTATNPAAVSVPTVASTPGRWVSRPRNGGFRVHVARDDTAGQRIVENLLAVSADRRTRTWTIPEEAYAVADLIDKLVPAGFGFDPDAVAALGAIPEVSAAARTASGADQPAAGVDIPGLAGDLLAYQAAGVEYLLAQRRCLVADSMGLGKTLTSLAAVAAADAWPVVIACPASLRQNWAREVRKWFPQRFAVTVRSKERHSLDGCDAVVISYELLDAHLPQLAKLGIGSFICDESHFVKDPRAKRSKAAAKAAKLVPDRGLVLCLSGTPILNRPVELTGQLAVLGLLDRFGGWSGFVRRYCAAEERKLRDGRTFLDVRGASNLVELQDRLRRVGYIRRRKSEVLADLPPKRFVRVPVSVDRDLPVELVDTEGRRFWASYADYEHDYVDTAVRRTVEAARADGVDPATVIDQARVKAEARELFGAIQDLHQIAGVAKLGGDDGAVAWLRRFLDDTSEEAAKIVVFAHHRQVVAAIADELSDHGARRIWGGQDDDERTAAVDAFQKDPKCRVLVCSIKAAGMGLTLTAASDVAFIQPAWTPADMDQASDRCHRIGQQHPVTIWHLVGEDTVDERIYRLLDTKAGVVDSVTDGIGQGVLDALAVELLGGR